MPNSAGEARLELADFVANAGSQARFYLRDKTDFAKPRSCRRSERCKEKTVGGSDAELLHSSRALRQWAGQDKRLP
jgi:hypothetical protein